MRQGFTVLRRSDGRRGGVVVAGREKGEGRGACFRLTAAIKLYGALGCVPSARHYPHVAFVPQS